MTAVERRKNKRKVDRAGKEEEKEELSKLQKSVVSWLKSNVPSKKTKFEHSHVVEYFSATKVGLSPAITGTALYTCTAVKLVFSRPLMR